MISTFSQDFFNFFFKIFVIFWFAIDLIQHKAVLRVWIAFIKILTYYYFVQFSAGPGTVFKQFFAFEFYSVAYFFSIISFIFELV